MDETVCPLGIAGAGYGITFSLNLRTNFLNLGQARALMLLSPMQATTEDNPAATASATRALKLYRDLGDRTGQAAALTTIGLLHTVTDDYPGAYPWAFVGGTIRQATVDVAGEPWVDLEKEVIAAFARD